MTKFCDKCGHQLKKDNAKFCDNCGAEVKITENQNNLNTNVANVICPTCNQATPMGQTICVNCGAQIQVEDNSLAVAAGYIVTFLFSIIGIIPAIYLLTRNNGKAKTQGLWIIVTVIISVISGLLLGPFGIIITLIFIAIGVVIWVNDTIIIS